MARAVYRKNKDGKVIYVGHVPPWVSAEGQRVFWEAAKWKA